MNNVQHQEEQQDEFSFKKLFIPLTTFKAIHIIVVLGFIVFANMLFNGFVLDDKPFIINNPEIKSIDLLKLIGPNLFNDAPYYRPLPAVYFATLYSTFVNVSFFYHLLQLVIHIINASLLYKFFTNFFKKYISLLLSLIFLVHPIQVESVSYIASSGNPLFFLFGMSALLLSVEKEVSIRRIVFIFTLLFLSLLSKETGFLFLILILFFRLFIKKKREVWLFVGGVSITLLYLFIRFTVLQTNSGTKIIPIAELSFLERLINIPAIIFYYINTFFFPKDLVIVQNWIIKTIDFPSFYLPLLLIVLFFSLLFFMGGYIFKKDKKTFQIFVFFLFWFLLGLSLHLQIIPLDMTVADRWFYLPIVGLLGLIGINIELIQFKKEKIKLIFVCLAVQIIVIFSLRTIVRNSNWVDPITLYKHDIKIKNSYILENGMGNSFLELGKYDEALVHYKKSAEMLPNEQILSNIAFVYERMGDKEKAKEFYYKALNERSFLNIPGHKHLPALYRNLIRLLLITNEFEAAKKVTEFALDDYPNSGTLWMWLAISEYKLGNQKEAIAAAEKAKGLSPDEKTDAVYMKILKKEPLNVK